MLRPLALLLGVGATVFAAPLWTQAAPDDPAHGPAPRLGSAALSLPGGGLALTGGCSSSCCYAPLNDMWAFVGGAWTCINQTATGGGAIPTGRLYHGASPGASAGASYVFGGNDILNGMLNELWSVTVSGATAQWRQLNVPAPPVARSGHSQCALSARALGAPSDGSFVVFGGETEDATLGDVWVFNPSGSGAWAALSPAGAAVPGPRTQHAAVAVALSTPSGSVVRALVIAGGSDANGDDHDDVWLLAVDAAPPSWLLLGSSDGAGGSPWPSVRHGHTVWGGSGGSTGGTTSLTIALFGGQNSSIPEPSNLHGDSWRFDVDVHVADDGTVSLAGGAQGRFTLLDAGGGPAPAPTPRALGGTVSSGGALVYASGFSGYEGGTDDRLHNDVWVGSVALAGR